MRDFPANMRVLSECQPVYETLKGWDECPRSEWYNFADKGYDAMPRNLRMYVDYIEEELGIPIMLLSFGPERKLTIERVDIKD